MKLFSKKSGAVSQKDSSDQPRRRVVQLSQQARKGGDFAYYRSHITNSGDESGERSRFHGQFEEKGKKASRNKKVLLWIGLVTIAVVFWMSTSLGSSPEVLTIDMKGTVGAPNDDRYEAYASELLRGNILNRNKITIDSSGIARSMQKKYPEIQSATVVVPMIGNRPKVYIELPEPVFALKSGGKLYSLSNSGYVTSQISSQSSKLPMIIDEADDAIAESSRLLPASHVKFIYTVYYQLTHEGVAVDSIVLPKGNVYEIDVRPKGSSFVIRFNLAEDPIVQSGVAVATLERLGDNKPAQYLDVRVPGRAYYK